MNLTNNYDDFAAERDEFFGQVYNEAIRACNEITESEPMMYTAPIKEVFELVVEKLGARITGRNTAEFHNTFIILK